MPIPSPHVIPSLLSILTGLLLSLVVWAIVRDRYQEVGVASRGTPDRVLLAMLLLAAFAMGVFLTFLLLTFGGN